MRKQKTETANLITVKEEIEEDSRRRKDLLHTGTSK